MLIFETIKSLQLYLSSFLGDNKIGFVPTMGALHQGHLSLIQKSIEENDVSVVSIFVNPTQFNNQDDLLKYPKNLSKDITLLESVSCDVLFAPSADEIYKNKLESEAFVLDGLENQMEGRYRNGHFDGVGTVVKRLFEIVNPTNAYFGEKDFQQLQIIRKLVEKTELKVTIHGCEIIREADGLAMSSRNVRLNKNQRQESTVIYKTLRKVKRLFLTKSIQEITEWVSNEFSKNAEMSLEYFLIADEQTLKSINTKELNSSCRAFIAVNIGDIRLIDNINL
ncbi:MAG: pantoate--beta-alanine ligase [Flavobacteriaceae bacterium]|nr:pantoate--beta-alanine ligase [Flavobacteriaceae bacterium]